MPALRALVAADLVPALVVTAPDRRRRRRGSSEPSPVAVAAEAAGIPVHRTADVNAPESVAAIEGVRPDLGIVVAFGQILRRAVLEAPRLGHVNLHFSLLPRWRGAAPVQRALEAGDPVTGVTVQRVVPRLDAGPVIAVEETAIEPTERAGELEARLADLGGAVLVDVVAGLRATDGLPAGTRQDPAAVTHAAKIEAGERDVDPALAPVAFRNRVHALHPWPLARLALVGDGEPVPITLHRVEAADVDPAGAVPGTVLAADRSGIVLAVGGGSVRLLELQRPGKRAMAAGDFLNGMPVAPGARFECATR